MRRPPLEDAAALRAWRDQTLYRLLLRAGRAETTAMLGCLRDRGYADISVADANLLASLDTEGATVSALARRIGVTRQAVSQQIVELERAGYIERRPSPTDGRAVIVIQTAHGRALLEAALDVVAGLEDDYTRHLGPRRLASLKRSLSALVDQIDPGGGLGAD